MEVKVFLSSTSEDLKQDCRPKARKYIEMANAKAITMETWDTDYQNAVQLCREKIREKSTHYLGIIAYRRGWVPNNHTKSITELEFDWSIKYKKTMVIFVPDHTSSYALTLKGRAEKQSQEDLEAQELFQNKVAALGTYQPFSDLADLCVRIFRKVDIWSKGEGGGLREIAKKAAVKSQDNSKGPLIMENELLKLGRKKQLRQFQDSLEEILDLDVPFAVGFLVYGEPGFGHSKMINRLYSEIETSRVSVKSIELSIGASWRQNSITEMLRLIGEEIQVNLVQPSINHLASRLREHLADNDVVLTINNLQRLEDSGKEFQERFWQPLVKALGKGFKNRFIALLSFEGDDDIKNQLALCDPSKLDDFQDQFIVLDELKEFKQSELNFWLRDRYSPDEAKTLSKTLIAESKGGNPLLLYSKLLTELK
jgi:hypothetical protein